MNKTEKHPEQKKQLPFTGIKSKMLIYFGLICASIIIGILVIYLFGIPILNFHGALSNQRVEVLQTLNLIADLKKERLELWINQREHDVSIIVNSNIAKDLTENLTELVRSITEISNNSSIWIKLQEEKDYLDLVQFIDNIERPYSINEGILIADVKTGNVICSPDSKIVGSNISGQDYFMNILSPGIFQNISIINKHPFHNGIEDRQFHFVISHRIYSSRNNPDEAAGPIAVLAVFVNTDYFIKPLLHTGGGLGSTGEALLVSMNAKILSPLKYELPDGSTAEVLEYEIIAKPAVFAARGEEGIISAIDYRGIPVLAAYRHILINHETGWGLVVKIDEEEVFAAQRNNIAKISIISFIGLVMFVILCNIFANKLSRPIRHLSKTAELLSKGRLHERSHVISNDEIGILSSAFNSMADQIESWHNEFEIQLKKRTASLEAVNKELEQFVFIASHDLRSPLINIEGYSKEIEYDLEEFKKIIPLEDIPEGVNEKYKQFLNDEIPESLNVIKNSVRKMDALLSGLLKISRSGRAMINKKPVNMNMLIVEVIESFDFEIKKIDAELKVSGLPDCESDEMQLSQVFSNLISNAIKYRKPGRKLKIKIYGKKNTDNLQYYIEDNGIGIDEKHVKRIFELFQRLNPKKTSGDGIGLTIVNKIMKKLNGSINVKSEPDKGSTFYITLPLKNYKENV